MLLNNLAYLKLCLRQIYVRHDGSAALTFVAFGFQGSGMGAMDSTFFWESAGALCCLFRTISL